MPVIVNHGLGADLLGLDDKPARPIGAQTRDLARNTVGSDINPGQGKSGRVGGNSARERPRARQGGTGHTHGGVCQNGSAADGSCVHAMTLQFCPTRHPTRQPSVIKPPIQANLGMGVVQPSKWAYP